MSSFTDLCFIEKKIVYGTQELNHTALAFCHRQTELSHINNNYNAKQLFFFLLKNTSKYD